MLILPAHSRFFPQGDEILGSAYASPSSAYASPRKALRSAPPVSNGPSPERPRSGNILNGNRHRRQQQLLARGVRWQAQAAPPLLQCRGKSQVDFEERGSRLPGVWPPQPLPPSTDCRGVRAQGAGPGKGLGGAPAPHQPAPWMWMAWHKRSRVCSSLFVPAARRTAGLAVAFSVLALAAREARHTQQSGEAAESGCLARKAGACSGALLSNMAAPAGGNASAGG